MSDWRRSEVVNDAECELEEAIEKLVAEPIGTVDGAIMYQIIRRYRDAVAASVLTEAGCRWPSDSPPRSCIEMTERPVSTMCRRCAMLSELSSDPPLSAIEGEG